MNYFNLNQLVKQAFLLLGFMLPGVPLAVAETNDIVRPTSAVARTVTASGDVAKAVAAGVKQLNVASSPIAASNHLAASNPIVADRPVVAANSAVAPGSNTNTLAASDKINPGWLAVLALSIFLPFTTITYHLTHHQRRNAKIDRIANLLGSGGSDSFILSFRQSGNGSLMGLVYATLISIAGLMLLFRGSELFTGGEFPTISINGKPFPQSGSLMVVAMAFFGAYLWGLQNFMRRYSLADLTPSVYFLLSLRMVFASMLAFIIYNGNAALSGDMSSTGGITSTIWPTLAFLLGMFPQRGLRWLMTKVPIFSESNPTVRDAPLEMIEGIETHDLLRLEELAIDSCYDLSNMDFLPLVLRTPYSARQLLDWILQAKLIIYFGEGVKQLRQQGIRTILDIDGLNEEEQLDLTQSTSITSAALNQAIKALKNEKGELERLKRISELLGQFVENPAISNPVTCCKI